ncbi:elongation factor 4 [Candidatus Roizmanbacteria bacterium RIFCSPLOWO2_12_FULL_40_12]|uniref:Elongation factor 4 n=1 Tax=Candidatus Roizmanbacteria bacterium RIFCSPLOWO2_01_FULL_40_42 TaxID=1802066 RepID=A0A1F7J5G0_9BACT|nr:MAG: elongation factor 4 [Candidatus Roizmanbacteria bacterium RIFCSPHIGHO2_01_FULL_40_98]OGK28286.1 MAG: elongation factor 4 [Candidatus Roizmanbacteria bacterium RIFCSPHIGHO2_02_FULL_40_53]OGK30522.1 MAG: elongation factor 4 [Candidatus Roizmanbacteria bacterium RIFCSPHIGHO2_12_41_18]OGK36936.1 MAG: elongation factor 4 [Candidatus Roizmanbacteria bacterium RIFCSPHIGHO2_12_FULL_40_130]OGK50842.1 MAG: elongation factor 4 [Candidatus Roizmanbacteria bacterium RIFCSPLOWO2_01_FULL_40_42]OGK599
MKNLRNFAIIAHVDHGKSTLADRFLELTDVVSPGKHEEQLLDRNPISRERGITIKLAPVQMAYKEFILNLIDTPGHVDFSYEVDRTLSCVEGVILLVDATKGIQAQTISNAYKALEKNLTIIPIVNKIDLPHADVEKTKSQMVDFLGVKKDTIFEISAKTGLHVPELLESISKKILSPPQKTEEPLQALIFDSYYDPHRGVIAFVRIFTGKVKRGDSLLLLQQGVSFDVLETGIFAPELKANESLGAGEIGYIVTNLKDIHKVRVGDTITVKKSDLPPLPGYKKAQSMVYASIFTTDTNDYLNLKKALEKLYLNDSSLEFTGIHSKALGAGFRVGFLGLLHADVVRERLEREHDLSLVLTPPKVEYRKAEKQGEIMEPYVKLLIVTPREYMADVMRLSEQHRGVFITMDNKNQITLTYEMPLSEMITDFFDDLKSVSSGFASLDWEFLEYRNVSADKMTILLNEEPIEEFSEVVVAERAYETASKLVKKLREIIPRQQYEVKIQARYKGKIIASERLSPFRKDVTQKLYGGDRTRKDKLLKKQKAGKKKMKLVGRVEIPKEAFLKLFKRSD